MVDRRFRVVTTTGLTSFVRAGPFVFQGGAFGWCEQKKPERAASDVRARAVYTMARSKQGTIVRRGKQLYARIRWTEMIGGKKVAKEKFAPVRTRTEGREKCKEMLRDLDLSGPRLFAADRLTFAELADVYAQERLISAQYAGEQKIAGLRSLASAKTQLKRLVAHFGPYRVQEIGWEDLDGYKRARFRQVTLRGRPPVVATVNRELERLRNVLNFAVRRGWLVKNPFAEGQPLIHKADEALRERIPTLEEQNAILAQCTGRRAYLRPILILLRDTGLRPSEAFRALVSDVDFTPPATIHIRQMNSKTGRPRLVGLTQEAAAALAELIQAGQLQPGDRLFGLASIRRSYAFVCRAAGVQGVTLYAWRHLNATDMVRAKVPDPIAMKSLGHTEYRTFKRYVTIDKEVAGESAASLDEYRRRQKG